MRNIVLIQPAIGDMDQFRDCPTPPVALCSAATYLSGDYEIRVVDQRVDTDVARTLSVAIDRSTVAVGITSLTGGMIKNGLKLARTVRRLSEVPIVWGGVHPSLLPRQTAEHELVDYVVEGEGERRFCSLVQALEAGDRGPKIQGVWYRDRGKIFGIPASDLEDLNALPGVPWHVVDMDHYIGRYRGRRQFFYQSSRGCPFRCAYCYNNAYNRRRWRAKDPEKVLSELQDLRNRYDFQSVYFLDDDFFVDRKRAFRILSGLHEMGLNSILQGVDIRSIYRMTDEELRFLEEVGVERISIGVESGTDRIRCGMLHKWGSIEVVREQFRRLAGRRFLVLATFIVGFPDESRDDMLRTLDLALWTLDAGPNFRVPQLYNFTPYPGTELYALLAGRGFSFPKTLDDWGDFEWDNNQVYREQPKLKDFLDRVVFVSKFLDSKADDYGFGGSLLRAAYNMYRPVARFRARTGFLQLLPERVAYDLVKRLV